MSRIPIAALVFLAGFTGYLVAAIELAELVTGLHWSLQALYFVTAGTLWVVPARSLMLWAAGK